MIVDEAFERIEGASDAPVLLTCEHASERLPAAWRWPDADARLRGTHWAFDPGAREIVHELAAALGLPAVLSRFTRLLADPNREPDHPDLFRKQAEGLPVVLNASIDAAEAQLRSERYHAAYHGAVDAAVRDYAAPLLLSVHTFTPLYEGARREVQVGVLFNRDEGPGEALLAHLAARLPEVRENEPWSGKEGLIYAVERHAEAHGRTALELEVRQDLATDAAYRARLIEALAPFLRGG